MFAPRKCDGLKRYNHLTLIKRVRCKQAKRHFKRTVKTEPEDAASMSPVVDDEVEVLTLESLGKRLHTVAKSNKTKLEAIEKLMGKEVVCGFAYSMKVCLPNNAQWKMNATPGKASVSDRLSEWAHNGTPLHKINYSFSGFQDVRRLNETLFKVGSKYYKSFGGQTGDSQSRPRLHQDPGNYLYRH